jgi:hypothetical protein
MLLPAHPFGTIAVSRRLANDFSDLFDSLFLQAADTQLEKRTTWMLKSTRMAASERPETFGSLPWRSASL